MSPLVEYFSKAQHLQQSNVHVEMDFGEIDPLIPLSDVEKIRSSLTHIQNIHIRTHANLGHGFSHTDTIKYNDKASKQATKGVLGLINTFELERVFLR